MGHILKRTMGCALAICLRLLIWVQVKAKDALCSLTKDRDGVEGSSIYIYGEGWDFGEVDNNGRGVNASQINIFGTGIGSGRGKGITSTHKLMMSSVQSGQSMSPNFNKASAH